jgi:NADP-dependent 3-hydroxy acid dehydrogenase YdfG
LYEAMPRVVAITGASAGIGRATAVRLARDGASLVLLARRQERLDQVVSHVRDAGGRAIAVPGDVAREGDIDRMVSAAVSTFGRLDVMMCNAGIGYHGTIDETPTAVMRQLVDTNILGTLYAARAALRVFRRQDSGHLIAVSSIVGRRGVPGAGLYAATKAAQAGLIEALRAECVGTGLHASIVYPVSVESEFRAAQFRDYGRRIEGHGPRQQADEVAEAIASCIARPRPEVYPYRLAKWLAVINVVAPGVADRLTRRYGRRVAPPVP